MSRVLHGVALALLVLFPALDSPAQRSPTSSEVQPRTFTLSGTLRFGDSGQPAEMIRIDLKRFTGEVVNTAFSHSSGTFEFSGLSRGTYYLIVEVEGFEPVREPVEIMNADHRGVVLFLSKPFVVRTVEREGTVSVRELALPRQAREEYEKGRRRLFEKRDPQGSLAHLQRAVGQVPAYYQAYHLMGMAYAEMGKQAEAEAAYRKSIELSGDAYVDPHVWLSALFHDQRKFAEAEAAARRAVEIGPGEWQGYFHLARAQLGLNRLGDANKSIREAIARNANFPDLYLVRANVHIRGGDYPALLQDLDAYLRLAPNGPYSASARQMRAEVLTRLAAPQPKP